MRHLAAILALCLIAWTPKPHAAVSEVDVSLVLAADTSPSMEPDELQAQRDGYAAAFVNPEVLDAIRQGPTGRIAVCYVEWAGPNAQAVVVPWTIISDAETAQAFVARIKPAEFADHYNTAIAAALTFAGRQFADAPVAARRVVDVSGDGSDNSAGDVPAARAKLLAAGIVVNGLPITIHPSPSYEAPLAQYYAENIAGGIGSFVEPVAGVGEFEPAIRRKIVREIASLPSPTRFAANVEFEP